MNMIYIFGNKFHFKVILFGIFFLKCIKGDTQQQCDFETDQCGFVGDDTQIAKWIRNFGPSWMRSTVGTTGPTTDHTPGANTGFYMVMLNIPNLYVYNPGDKARMTSPCYPASRTVDVTFYYHMYGDGIGELNVFLVDCSLTSSALGLSVIDISGDQNDGWKPAGFSQANVGEFKLVFEAVRGPTNNSDIAIDDITVRRTEPSTSTVPQEFFDEAVALCTFESGACEYQQDLTDDTNFIYNHGTSWLRNTNGSTGPTGDHTGGSDTNFYMILLNVPGILDLQPGDKARLISPCYEFGEWLKIIFFYHMYGEGMGTLKVYSSNCNTATDRKILFSKSGNQGDVWKEGSGFVHTTDESVMFIFEAIRGSDSRSDIAIDDIAVYVVKEEDIITTTEKVTTTVAAPTTTTTEFSAITEAVVIATTKSMAPAADPATEPKVITTRTPAVTQAPTSTVITEDVSDSCESNPCKNGGQCTTSGTSYACTCSSEWTGDRCELQIAQVERATEEDDSGGLTTINIVAIVIACIAVIILLGCFITFGYRRSGQEGTMCSGESERKEPPSYERARQMQEQLQGRQMHLPKTKQTYQQKQQLMEEEKRRQAEEQRRHEEAEELRRQRLREMQERRERELQEQLQREEEEEEQQLFRVQHQISADSIEDIEAATFRPPLRKQQSNGRKLPQIPSNQNYV